MDAWEKEHIVRHLPELIQLTTCNSSTVAFLYSEGILSEADRAVLDCEKNELSKSNLLYDIAVKKTGAYQKLIEAFRTTQQSGVVTILEKYLKVASSVKRLLPSVEVSSKKSRTAMATYIRFDVQTPVELFTGREEDLAELHKNISSLENSTSERIAVISQIVSVCGLGGIGKTQLARQYILKHGSNFDNLIWINAETEGTMDDCFRKLAKDKMEIKTKDSNGTDKETSTIISEVYDSLEGSKSLLIFDNAERGDHMGKFLPRNYVSTNQAYVLITSRDQDWQLDALLTILGEMKVEDAIEFVMKGLKEDYTTRDSAFELVQALQRFPLAIQQAISYILQENLTSDSKYTVLDYLKEFESQRKVNLLDFHEFRVVYNDYNMTTFTTWRMTIEKISQDPTCGSLAVKILHTMGYLSATNMERGMFKAFVGEGGERELRLAVKLLAKYSMCKVYQDNSQRLQNSPFISIHRLVQEVIRIELRNTSKEESVLKNALNIIQSQLSERNTNILTHSSSVWNHATEYPSLVQEFSSIPASVVREMVNCVRYNDAHAFATGPNGLPLLSRVKDANCGDILQLQYQIARVLMEQGKYEDALEAFQELLSKRQETLGPRHVDSMDTEHFVALVIFRQGNYKRALPLFSQVLEKRKQVLGLENEKTVHSLNAVGACSMDLGRYSEAIEIFKSALSSCLKIFGEDSILAVSISQNIAVCHRNLGNISEAIQILRAQYNKKDILGDTPPVLKAGHNLAYYLILEGRDDAKEVCEDVISRRTRALGEDHPDTWDSLNTLGRWMRMEGRLQEALVIHQKVYHRYCHLLGKEHTMSLLVKADIASVWTDQNLVEEACFVFRNVLPTLEKAYESCSGYVVGLKLELARALEKNGETTEAKQVLEGVKKQIIDAFGESHPWLLKVNQGLGNSQQ